MGQPQIVDGEVQYQRKRKIKIDYRNKKIEEEFVQSDDGDMQD